MHNTDNDCEEMDDADEEWAQPFKIDIRNNDMVTDAPTVNQSSVPVSKLGHSRTIIHFDIDCFYAQVEMLRNPELRSKPLGIQQKNIVVTCNYVARKWGVTKLMYIADAKRKCPDLVLVSGEDLTNYRQMSYQISEFMQKYTPNVERLGFDENFVDVSEMVSWRLKEGKYKPEFIGHVYGNDSQIISRTPCSCGCELRLQIGSQIAADIREALEKEIGISCCAGIAHNKLLAKLVAATHKPNQQTSVLPHRILELITSLPSARCIPGIGSSCSRRLQALGISSIQDLQRSDLKLLEREFGPAMAQLMNQLCFGVDDSLVVTYSLPQTLSDEDSFKSCSDYNDAEQRIKDLLTSLLKRVVEDGRIPQTVRLTVRRVNNNSHRESRQCPVPGNIFSKYQQESSTDAVHARLMPILMNLFCKLVDLSVPFHLTLINICFAKLVKPEGEQGKISSFFTRGIASPQDHSTCEDADFRESQHKDVVRSVAETISSTKKSQTSPKMLTNFFSQTSRPKPSRSSTESGSDSGTVDDLQRQWKDKIISSSGISDTEILHMKSMSCQSYQGGDLKPEKVSNDCQLMDQPYVMSETSAALDSKVCQTETFSSANELRVPSEYKMEEETSFDPREDIGTALEENSLQTLLPSEVDAKTIAELPADVQKEVLSQYGIFVEDLPEGRRFTVMSDKVTTRSGGTSHSVTLKTRRPLFSPKKGGWKRKSTQDILGGDDCSYTPKNKRVPQIDLDEGHTVHGLSPQNFGTAKNEACLPVELCTSVEHSAEYCDKSKQKPEKSYEDQGFSLLETTPFLVKSEAAHGSSLTVHQIIKESEKFEKSQLCSERVANFQSTKSDSGLHKIHRNPQKIKSNLADSRGVHTETTVNSFDSDHDSDSVSKSNIPSAHQILPQATGQQKGQTSPHSGMEKSMNKLSPVSQRVCGQSSSHHHLPDHIDPEVFEALPSNIRGEIMAHIVMGSSSSRDDHSRPKTDTLHEQSSKKAEVSKKKGQNTLLTYFKKDSGQR